MAGDEDDRADFLQTTIVGNVLYGGKRGAGEAIQSAITSGSGMRQRSFYRWCRDNYVLGMPDSVIGSNRRVPTDTVRAGILGLLNLNSNQELRVNTAVIDDADTDYWAETYILQNRPDLVEDDWSSEYNAVSGNIELSIVNEADIIIAGPSDMIWGFNRGGVNSTRKILFAAYTVLTQNPTTLEIVESGSQLFTYRMGTGNVVFDALTDVTTPLEGFFPVIPMRINNVAADERYNTGDYANIKKAYKKLTKRSLDDLLEDIEDNDSIDDIDFAFVVQGVNLTTQEKVGKRYLYDFFETLMADQNSTKTQFEGANQTAGEQATAAVAWDRWITAHGSDAAVNGYHPINGEPAPTDPVRATSPATSSEIRINSSEIGEFDYRIIWNYIHETLHIGNGKTFDGVVRDLLKVGECWITLGRRIPYVVQVTSRNSGGEFYEYITRYNQSIYLFKQYHKFRYSRLEIMGLQHRSYVYAGQSVTTTAESALTSLNNETEDAGASGFLIPLHYPTLTSLGLVKGTQLSNTSSYLVFNSYKQVKQKWYQRGFFKVILVIAAAVLSVVFAPAGAALGAGILGSNVALGVTIGVTSSVLASAIAGAVANALAAMILTQLISKFSVQIFGDKLGAIIGTIVSFVAMQYAGTYANTGSFDFDWSSLMRAENLVKLTNSVSSAYTQWLNADTMDIYGSMGELKTGYEDEMDKIENIADEILGMTSGIIDPMMLTDVDEYLGESRETFLGRTLLTGSDIAELTYSMIENFADISLELPKAIR